MTTNKETRNMKSKRLANVTLLKVKSNARLPNRDAEPGLRLETAGNEIYETGDRSDEGVIGIAGKRAPRQRKTHASRKKTFLRAFGDSGLVAESALLAGIDRATHYKWLATDAKYSAAFEATKPMAAGAVQDHAVRLARVGFFEPLLYKGQVQYATRKRTLCKLTDGTTGFEDELPKGARVSERRTVMTRDGEMLGVYRPHAGLLLKLLAAFMPEEYGTGRRPIPEKYPIASGEDASDKLLAALSRWRAIDDSSSPDLPTPAES
jgi:hypothetical protein